MDYACDTLLSNKRIRYVGILNKMGNLIFEKQQQGIDLLVPNKNSRSLYIKSVLEILFEKDFDKHIGMLSYNVSHRTKIDVITIPMFEYVILITVKTKENCDLIAQNAITLFEKIFKK